MKTSISKSQGLLALSPLLVFLCVYLVSSIIAQDFYKIPVSSAFLISSVYAMLISKGKTLEERVETFSKGAGNKNVLLMIWIFVMAGAFAATAKEIGAIDATVNLALKILPLPRVPVHLQSLQQSEPVPQWFLRLFLLTWI